MLGRPPKALAQRHPVIGATRERAMRLASRLQAGRKITRHQIGRAPGKGPARREIRNKGLRASERAALKDGRRCSKRAQCAQEQ